MRSRFPLLLTLLAVSLGLAADKTKNRPGPFDWPQWQGVNRTAISQEKGLLQEWPKDGPKLAWKVEGLGENYCTPTVAAGRIFLMTHRDNKEYVLALSEKDGKEIWAKDIGPRVNVDRPGARCSPTVDGEFLYALGVGGSLVCMDVESGNIKWRKELRKDFMGNVGGWGYSESPLIDGDKLICTPGGATATLLALNKENGEVIWKGVVEKGEGAHYSSIAAAEVDGKRQYIQFLSSSVVGFSADGKFLWRYTAPANGTANCSTPICKDGYVFAASGYGKGGGLAKLVKNGDGYSAKEVYFTRDMQNQHGGMVLLDGFLYGSNEGELVCMDFKTGEVQWKNSEPNKGSISYADGRLYYRAESGPVTLVEANPKKYVNHGQFTPPRSKRNAWSHPVIANGKLYLQDTDFLLCYDIKVQ